MGTFVIGEAGSTHDGSLDKAYRLIDAIASCGASAAKFQYWSSAERLAERRNAPDYLDVYRRYQMPRDWLPLLKERCDMAGVEFMATVYLPEDVRVLDPFIKTYWKVASFEARCPQLRNRLAAHVGKRTVIVSRGMGAPFTSIRHDITPKTLLCTSAYPCPIDQVGLSRMMSYEYEGATQEYDGLSDHTTSTLTGAVAVGAGATILEKHVRLHDTDPQNPDYATALVADHTNVPWAFAEYVRLVREAERMMGTGERRVMPAEEAMLKYRVKA